MQACVLQLLRNRRGAHAAGAGSRIHRASCSHSAGMRPAACVLPNLPTQRGACQRGSKLDKRDDVCLQAGGGVFG